MLRGNISGFTAILNRGQSGEPIGFFSDCLCNATQFDLMLGFFSSSTNQCFGRRFRLFPLQWWSYESDSKWHSYRTGQKRHCQRWTNTLIPFFGDTDIEKLKNTLSERDTPSSNCLAWLIRNRLDIRIIAPKDGIGISHQNRRFQRWRE